MVPVVLQYGFDSGVFYGYSSIPGVVLAWNATNNVVEVDLPAGTLPPHSPVIVDHRYGNTQALESPTYVVTVVPGTVNVGGAMAASIPFAVGLHALTIISPAHNVGV
jgi:hypothetical protein